MKKQESGEDRLIGKQFGDYRLQRLLATGGMARIYEARDVKLDRTVAVKLLNLEGNPDTTLAHRFQREARAVAKLEHDNIITIYQYGEQGGFYYIAMKLVEGKDLSAEISRLRRNGLKMDIGRALFILEQVARALDHAHAQNIIHRDIKPSNILLDKYDRAMLTDFGLLLQATDDATKTQGTAFGTPRYIAPEQALDSAKAVPQSDIYALAVILYEIVCGEPPFSGETPMEIALGHIGDPPRPPRSINPKIPVGVERELLKALEKEPKNRHQSATEFIEAVKAAYQAEQPSALKSMPTLPPSTITEIPEKADGSDTPILEQWNDGSTSHLESAARPVMPPQRNQKRKLSPLLIAVGAGLLILAVWLGISAVSGGAGAELSKVTLQYDENTFFVFNGYENDLDVFPLQFVRGEDGLGRDDYSGDRIAGDELPAKSCYLLRLLAFDVALPSMCPRLYNYEELGNPQFFFWRSEPVDASTFEVLYDRQVVARCPTVSAGESQTCVFTLGDATPTDG